MLDQLEAILKHHGPMLSSELAKILRDEHRVSPQNARQKVSRRSEKIKSLAYLTFPRNARFLYLVSQYGSDYFWNKLISALEQSSVAYARALDCLYARDRFLPIKYFGIASGSPLALKKHLSAENVLERFKKAEIVHVFNIHGVGDCISLDKDMEIVTQRANSAKMRFIAEKIALSAIQDWAKKLALGSADSFKLRDNIGIQPRVGSFEWDLTAPSYITGLTQWSESKPAPGFLVCDILLMEDVPLSGVNPFIHKIKTLVNSSKKTKLLPIFVSFSFTLEALGVLRKNGVIPATLDSLFGKDISKSLKMLIGTLESLAFSALDPDKLSELFEQLSHIEGASGTLRGALFEYIVADLIRQTRIVKSLTMNKIFRENGKDLAEVDILIERNGYTTFIECKGHNPAVYASIEEIKKWFHETSTLRKIAEKNDMWKNTNLIFEFWTSGRLCHESIDFIENMKKSQKSDKYEIKIFGRDELREIVNSHADKPLKKVINQHFINYPLAIEKNS
ncbi:hypothetical protein ACSILQ_000662 [Yersinia enterocolitica]